MEWWADLATFLAYIFLTVGIISQVWKTYRSRSVEDIEILEVVGRSIAHVLIMWKMVLVADMTLIIGHAIITVVYLGYFCLVLKYKYFALA